MNNSLMIARLGIGLDEVVPRVRRRVEVPLSLTLADLHDTIQIIVGWTDSHLYEFRFGRAAYGVPDPDFDVGSSLRSAAGTRLDAVLTRSTKSFKYLYDFGDGWEHTIRLEAVKPAETAVVYPRLIAAQGQCPPEDVGGPYGYADFLDAHQDPDHPNHKAVVEWYDGSFDPNAVDIADIQKRLAALAKRLARRKRRNP